MPLPIKYHNIVWSKRKKSAKDTLYLTLDDVNHLAQIYKKYQIEPESVSKVRIEFIVQRNVRARFMIKELDYLLKVGGTFELVLFDNTAHSTYIRSKDQVKYEVSVSTNGRYVKQEETTPTTKTIQITYKKIKASLPVDDSIEKWSFGIITNGTKNDQVDVLIQSIIRQHIPQYEIVICGPYENTQAYSQVTVLSDVAIHDDIRAPISAKKNKIIQAATYNNLCIFHDRFYLPNDWFVRFQQYGNYFDFLNLPTVDDCGRRFRVDWMTFCDPITRISTMFNRPLRYSQWSSQLIIQGGIILGKKHLMLNNLLDERLYWGELEDMHFSKMVSLQGSFINTDVNNYVISKAVNHAATEQHAGYLKECYAWLRGVCVNFLKFHYYQIKYALGASS